MQELLSPIIRTMAKFLSLKAFDHYTAMDKMKEEQRKKEKHSPWKTQTDELKNIDTEFKAVELLRMKRKRSASNIQAIRTVNHEK